MSGLPPDAAVWRADSFTPTEEFLALLLERYEAWSGAALKALLNHKRILIPAPVEIERPGRAPEAPARVETDPRALAAFFAKHINS